MSWTRRARESRSRRMGAGARLAEEHREQLTQLAVTAEARGRGVGQALVTAAEELIGTAHDRAELAVVPGNSTARRLYERCGWTDLGEVTMPARPGEAGGPPVPVVVRHYVKQLR